ncbi:MAG: hypothetical protein GC181_08855 [Bacteroidetes bacterium]|nr:hypothetical protein [Bacteroidota bacterium]
MKKYILLLIAVALSSSLFAQVPPGGISITEPGDNLGTTTTTTEDGTTIVVIVCACSEATCYTVTRGINVGGSQSDDCGGTGLNAWTNEPQPVNVTIKVNGVVIANGDLSDYQNSGTNGDVITRTHQIKLSHP